MKILNELIAKIRKNTTVYAACCSQCQGDGGETVYPHYGLLAHVVIDGKDACPPNVIRDRDRPRYGTYTHCMTCGADKGRPRVFDRHAGLPRDWEQANDWCVCLCGSAVREWASSHGTAFDCGTFTYFDPGFDPERSDACKAVRP